MGALFLNSFLSSPNKSITPLPKNCYWFSAPRKRVGTTVFCQGSGGRGGGRGSVPASSLVVNAAGSLELSPNWKVGKPGIDSNVIKDLVPCNNGDTSALVELQDGIGIVKFLRGKGFFITGATGFLAKVFIEKILRTVPDVGKIFLLIKANSEEAAMERLQKEIINSELFKNIRKVHGKSYQSFMLNKLVPVIGNVCDSDLGLGGEVADVIAEEIDIIVNSAANTTFDERYDVAIDINTRGPFHLMSFAKKCNKLKLFLQISTAYVNGQRQGRIMEKAFEMGDSIAKENFISDTSPRFVPTAPTLDVDNEIDLALKSRELASQHNQEVSQKMKQLGLERARKYGWQDTYVFTKAMGEMMINKTRGEVPVVIIRPSVIESTFNDPFPGWMEGNRMMDPIILYYGKGQLTGFLADPNCILDVVPADMVVNATLAAIARHGVTQKPDINVYQIASSAVNPLDFQHLARLMTEHFNSSPIMDSKGRPISVQSIELFKSMDDFSAHLWQDTSCRIGLAEVNDGKSSQKLETICRKLVEPAKHLANIYEPYTFYGGRFDNSNTERLMQMLSEEEKMIFGFDVRRIDWNNYIKNVHIPGLKKHVMKGRGIHV